MQDNAVQHNITQYKTIQGKPTHGNTRQAIAIQYNTTYSNTRQDTTTHDNTRQYMTT